MHLYKCLVELPNDEECDATNDDSSTKAGLIIFLIITLRQAQGDRTFLTFAALL